MADKILELVKCYELAGIKHELTVNSYFLAKNYKKAKN